MRCVIVIPARMGSTRFPGKPLCNLAGKPMIQWVVEAARRSSVADRILVATPDEEIIDACKHFGAEAILTDHSHPSGTDRIAEVAQKVDADVYVNVQGDEPLIVPETISACARPLLDDSSIKMGSIYSDCPDDESDNPAVVKVVTDRAGYAIYFSRHVIPYPRNERVVPLKKHVGIYAYRKDALQAFARWPMGELEHAEGLEQLRFLENGVRIFMAKGQGTELAVDTPDQAEIVERLLTSSSV